MILKLFLKKMSHKEYHSSKSHLNTHRIAQELTLQGKLCGVKIETVIENV